MVTVYGWLPRSAPPGRWAPYRPVKPQPDSDRDGRRQRAASRRTAGERDRSSRPPVMRPPRPPPPPPVRAADEDAMACRGRRRSSCSAARAAEQLADRDLAARRARRLERAGDRPSGLLTGSGRPGSATGRAARTGSPGRSARRGCCGCPARRGRAGRRARCWPARPARPPASRSATPCSFTRMLVMSSARRGRCATWPRCLDEVGHRVERAAEVVQRGAEVGALAGQVAGDLGELLLEVLDLRCRCRRAPW